MTVLYIRKKYRQRFRVGQPAFVRFAPVMPSSQCPMCLKGDVPKGANRYRLSLSIRTVQLLGWEYGQRITIGLSEDRKFLVIARDNDGWKLSKMQYREANPGGLQSTLTLYDDDSAQRKLNKAIEKIAGFQHPPVVEGGKIYLRIR